MRTDRLKVVGQDIMSMQALSTAIREQFVIQANDPVDLVSSLMLSLHLQTKNKN